MSFAFRLADAYNPRRSRRWALGTGALALALTSTLVMPSPSAGQTVDETPAEVTQETSDEGRYAPFATATEFVEQQYVDILRREATPAEVQYQAGLLENGRDPVDLIVEFVESAEANSNIKAVVRLYRAYYLRNPDFRGLSHWIRMRQQGIALDAISTQFARAPEFAIRYGVLDDEAFVDFVYERVMDRKADAKGRAYWLNRLATDIHRGNFMTYFSESAEYVHLTRFNTAAITLYTGMFQRSIKQGVASSLTLTLETGRSTVAEEAREYLEDRDYVDRIQAL